MFIFGVFREERNMFYKLSGIVAVARPSNVTQWTSVRWSLHTEIGVYKTAVEVGNSETLTSEISATFLFFFNFNFNFSFRFHKCLQAEHCACYFKQYYFRLIRQDLFEVASTGFTAGIVARKQVLVHLLNEACHVMYSRTQCCNSSYHILFRLHRRLTNGTFEVTTLEEVPTQI